MLRASSFHADCGVIVQLSSAPNPNPIRSLVSILQTVDSAKNAVLAYHMASCKATAFIQLNQSPKFKVFFFNSVNT